MYKKSILSAAATKATVMQEGLEVGKGAQHAGNVGGVPEEISARVFKAEKNSMRKTQFAQLLGNLVKAICSSNSRFVDSSEGGQTIGIPGSAKNGRVCTDSFF